MIRVENEVDQRLIAKVYRFKQEQVFASWDALNEAAKQALLEQLDTVDFQQLASLCQLLPNNEQQSNAEQSCRERVGDFEEKKQTELKPVEMISLPDKFQSEPQSFLKARSRGLEILASGKVAALMVAGGQGTRLGWPAPKGSYPLSPVRQSSLFQLFAEQLLAWKKRFSVAIPWVVMTALTNHKQTVDFFASKEFFGYPLRELTFMVQGQWPAVSGQGKLILKTASSIATSPDGHGGLIPALHRTKTLQALKNQGIETLFYFQVDNPLCSVLDPVFLGFHDDQGIEASTKVISKADPWQKVGVLGYQNGRLGVIEYSELDEKTRFEKDSSGQLKFRAGNIANHLFDVDFLIRIAETPNLLPFHVVQKKIPAIDVKAQGMVSKEVNGYKFETFIFDVLGAAKSHLTLEVDPLEEFAPVKNASGKNSPATAKNALIARARRWLKFAGLKLPENFADDGNIEILAATAFDRFALRDAAASITIDSNQTDLLI